MSYRLAIFDFDGTLHDSIPWFLRIVNTVADRHAFRRVTDTDIETLRTKSAREVLAHLEIPAWKVPVIARDMRRLKTKHLSEIPLFPGVSKLLGTLAQRGIVLAVVSSDTEANVRRALGPDNVGLIAHFACGASLFGKSLKFKRVLRLTGIPAAEAIGIGDETRDLEAAHKAGVAFGAVTWGYASAAVMRAHSADLIFSAVEDIGTTLLAPKR